jgi:membrane fusion protein (multidrug efflux system)
LTLVSRDDIMYLLTRTLHLASALLLYGVAVSAAPPPTQVFVAEARLDRFVDRVEALGTLRANESVSLTVSVTETVTALHFDDGDRVATGQVLAEMTSSEEHAQLEEARATVAEAGRQYQRVKSLAAQGTASKSLLDERHREWETGRARLAAIESRLADRLIRAPFAGIVGLRNVSIGALMEPGDLITTLDDDSVMKLDFAVPSTYLGTLAPGLAIEATTRAHPGQKFRGQVKSVDSRVDPATRSIVVRAILPNADRALKPGMLMQVELFKNPREAIVIPEEALLPQGERQTVLVVDEAQGNRTVQRELRIGARRPGEVEVLAGLAPGEKVITDGTLKVRPGEPVAIRAVDDGVQPLHELLESQPQGTGPE